MGAAERVGAATRATLDLQSEDQDHTAALLRNGAVLGAVTTLADPVQGCRIHALGSMRYIATCSPQFHQKYFVHGVNARTLARPEERRVGKESVSTCRSLGSPNH